MSRESEKSKQSEMSRESEKSKQKEMSSIYRGKRGDTVQCSTQCQCK